EYRTVFKNLVCAWNDPLTVCAGDETELLYQMLPCVYGPPKK
ncbi:8944_t:CDS:1, partial [Paraglomus brasilianum]